MSATFETRSKSLIRALGDFGYPVNAALVSRHWGLPFRRLVKALAPTIDFDSFVERYSVVMQEEPPRLTSGARALLEYFDGRGVPCVIHSSSLTKLVVQDLLALRVRHLISEVFGSDLTGYAKPDPRSLGAPLEWLEKQGCHPDQALYLGDSIRDLATAQLNDVPFIAVLTGQTTAETFRTAGFEGIIVPSLAALVPGEKA